MSAPDSRQEGAGAIFEAGSGGFAARTSQEASKGPSGESPGSGLLTLVPGADLEGKRWEAREATCDLCGVKQAWLADGPPWTLPIAAGWRWANKLDPDGNVRAYESADLCPGCAATFPPEPVEHWAGWRIQAWPSGKWVDRLPEPPTVGRFVVPAYLEPAPPPQVYDPTVRRCRYTERTLPTPGYPEAERLGCTCPVRRLPNGVPAMGRRVSDDCPLHSYDVAMAWKAQQ